MILVAAAAVEPLGMQGQRLDDDGGRFRQGICRRSLGVSVGPPPTAMTAALVVMRFAPRARHDANYSGSLASWSGVSLSCFTARRFLEYPSHRSV